MNTKIKQTLNKICREKYGRDYLDSLDISESILVEFARLMCEEQKQVCLSEATFECTDKIIPNEDDFSIKEESILNCKNVCD